MIDLTDAGFPINFEFYEGKAEEIKNPKGKVLSKGNKQPRMKIFKEDDENIYSVAVKSLTLSRTPPKLGWLESRYNVIVKVKNERGQVGYVVANSESLRKRFGLTKEEFKACKKTQAELKSFKKHNLLPVRNTSPIIEKIRNIYYELNAKLNSAIKNFEDGSCYEGSLDFEGKFHGNGKLTYANGSSIEGKFVHGHEPATAKFTFPDGDIYEGTFDKNNLFHGEGKFSFLNGRNFEGNFEHGNVVGNVRYSYPNGNVYEGPLDKENEPDGRGKLTLKNGDTVEGKFVNGQHPAFGKCTFANGDIYVGGFEKGKLCGKGKITYANGDTLEGIFLDGKVVEKVKHTSSKR